MKQLAGLTQVYTYIFDDAAAAKHLAAQLFELYKHAGSSSHYLALSGLLLDGDVGSAYFLIGLSDPS